MDSNGNASRWQETQKWTSTFNVPLRAGELRRLRRSKGLTLSALGQASGVSRHHISRIEHEPDATVWIDTARRLCRGLVGADATDDQLGQVLRELCVLEEETAGVHD